MFAVTVSEAVLRSRKGVCEAELRFALERWLLAMIFEISGRLESLWSEPESEAESEAASTASSGAIECV